MSADEQQSTVERWGNSVLKVHGDGSVGTCFVIDAERGLLWTCAHVLMLERKMKLLGKEEIDQMTVEQLREELRKRDANDHMEWRNVPKEDGNLPNEDDELKFLKREVEDVDYQWETRLCQRSDNEGSTCPKYSGTGPAQIVLIGMAAARGGADQRREFGYPHGDC